MRRKLVTKAETAARQELTPDDYAQLLAEQPGKVKAWWEKLVAAWQTEMEKIVDRLRKGPVEIAEVMCWGYGLDEGLLAAMASEALEALDGGRVDVVYILKWQLRGIEARQLGNHYRMGSSSRLSNAVEGARAAAEREYGDKARLFLEEMTELRAFAEVL